MGRANGLASAIPTPATVPKGPSIGTGGMLGDSSPHLSAGGPQPVAPARGAVPQAADELQLRLERTLDLRLPPHQLSAPLEIHPPRAGPLPRKTPFTAIPQAPPAVVPGSRPLLLPPG